MTNEQKFISWGLTGFFGIVCLAAAPQLSVGLLIKYGILSTALGFAIPAISNEIGKLFPDNPYPAAAPPYPMHHTGYYQPPAPTPAVILVNTAPQPRSYFSSWLPTFPRTQTPSGTYLGRRREDVAPPAAPTYQAQQHPQPLYPIVTPLQQTMPRGTQTAEGTFLGSRREAPRPAPVAPLQQAMPRGTQTADGTFLGSRREAPRR